MTMTRIHASLALIIGTLAALALPASAQDFPDPAAVVLGTAKETARDIQAATSGAPLMLGISVLLVVFVWVLRTLLAPRIAFFATRTGVIVISLLTSLGASVGTNVVAGVPPTWEMLASAVMVSVMASGGWSNTQAVREDVADAKAAKASAQAGFVSPALVIALGLVAAWAATTWLLVRGSP